MVSITKIFRFESGHAILGYPGACSALHGHSYELHVSVIAEDAIPGYIAGTGMIKDFKVIKSWVHDTILTRLDHKLLLSAAYLETHKLPRSIAQDIVTLNIEPTAENLVMMIRDELEKTRPTGVRLYALKLWETRDAYASWLANGAA